MNWKTIRLELAGTADFPKGSVCRGFLIRLPLNDRGRVDQDALVRTPSRATVRRFWSSDPDEHGHIVRVDGHWALRVAGKPDRLLASKVRLKPEEKVEVTEGDGAVLPFRVADVQRLG